MRPILSHAFPGFNIMTPNVIGYFARNFRGGTTHIELSEGGGMDHQPIFGVTFRTPTGAQWDPDPSKLCHSKAEALAWAQEAR